MKIKKIITQQNKFFNLKLLKTKIYTEKLGYPKRKLIELSLKKAFHIIYKFHATNKKILFFGAPLKKNTQIKHLLKSTKHTFLPKEVWVNGAISNSFSIIKHLFKRQKLGNFNKKKSKFLFKLNIKYDLIIVLNKNFNELELKEFLSKRIPIITIDSNVNSLNSNSSTYKILGNFNTNNKKIQDNYFYTILKTIFKKAKKNKKIYSSKKRRFINNKKNEFFKKASTNTLI